MVEINSPVCATSDELSAHLSDLRTQLAHAASQEGARLLAIAVPPQGRAAQSITKKPRYQDLADQWGLLAREQGVQPIFERVPFGKLAAHPAGTSALRNHCGQPAQIADRIRAD